MRITAKPSEKIEEVMRAAEGISYHDWLKLVYAMNRTFEEKERLARNELKLSDMERVEYFLKYPTA